MVFRQNGQTERPNFAARPPAFSVSVGAFTRQAFLITPLHGSRSKAERK